VCGALSAGRFTFSTIPKGASPNEENMELMPYINSFLEIDKTIHSAPSNLPWDEVEENAAIYVWKRKELILAMRRKQSQ
jgi:hypothetical protein